jgi:hypothetical protein
MIIVCGLNAVQDLVDTHGVKRVISLLGPDTPHRIFAGITTNEHLRLTFHDVVEKMEGFSAPQATDAELGSNKPHADPLLGRNQPVNGFGIYGALHAASQCG